METINREVDKQARIADLESRIAGIKNLLDKNLVSQGAKDKLTPSLAEYESELRKLKPGQDEHLEAAA